MGFLNLFSYILLPHIWSIFCFVRHFFLLTLVSFEQFLDLRNFLNFTSFALFLIFDFYLKSVNQVQGPSLLFDSRQIKTVRKAKDTHMWTFTEYQMPRELVFVLDCYEVLHIFLLYILFVFFLFIFFISLFFLCVFFFLFFFLFFSVNNFFVILISLLFLTDIWRNAWLRNAWQTL